MKYLSMAGAILLGFAAVVFFFHPGFMTNDPTAQLAEARSGLYTDLHPPMMAWVWHFLDQIIPGPMGMLIFHNLVFWAGLALWAHLLFKKPWKCAVFILGFGFFPPIFSYLGVIWKDVGMGASLLLGTALLYLFEKKRSYGALIGSIIFFLYGLAVRPNAAPALWPLFFWMVTTLVPRFRKAIVFTLLVCLASQIFVWLHTSWLIQGRKQYSYQPNLIYDIAAVSAATGENYFPDYLKKLNPNLTIDLIRSRYNTYNVAPLIFSDGTYHVQDSQEVDRLWKSWWYAVSQHPWLYLKHRIKYSVHFLSIGKGEKDLYPMYPSEVEVAVPVLKKIRPTFLFSNGTYMIATFILFFIAALQWNLPTLYIAASGLFYALPYFLVGAGCLFYYCWWTVISSIVAATLILQKKSNGRTT